MFFCSISPLLIISKTVYKNQVTQYSLNRGEFWQAMESWQCYKVITEKRTGIQLCITHTTGQKHSGETQTT